MPARNWSAWVDRLRAEEPGALAVVLQGSHARGDAGPFSDVDLRVVTAGPPTRRDRAYLEEEDGYLVHYSAGSRPLAELVAATADPEVWPWLAAHYATVKPLWDPDDVVGVLRRAVEANRPGPIPYADGLFLELEAMVEEAGKLRNAELAGDYAVAARAAFEAADQAWRVLQRCADPYPLPNQAAGIERMFRLGDGIPGYRRNLALCLGLSPDPRPLSVLSRAALDLVESVVVHVASLSVAQRDAGLAPLLAGDRLTRYLAQMRADASRAPAPETP